MFICASIFIIEYFLYDLSVCVEYFELMRSAWRRKFYCSVINVGVEYKKRILKIIGTFCNVVVLLM